MSVETRNYSLQYNKYKEGLIYDAESVILAGKHTDELSAHRAKRQWKEVLSSYFLLESERDYELWVESAPEDDYFVVHCCFVSACGRYAFWRLVNQQAPEAEARLGATLQNSAVKRLLATNRALAKRAKTPFVLGALDESNKHSDETISILEKLLKLFS